jgi:hypothetical protein
MANSTTSAADSNGIYHYHPSKVAAIVAALLFGASAIINLFQMIRKKTWFYTPMTVGAFSTLSSLLSAHIPRSTVRILPETSSVKSLNPYQQSRVELPANNAVMTGGYGIRYLSAKSPDSVMLYAQQSLLILLPPSLYAATIYMIYGRIVLFVNAPDASISKEFLRSFCPTSQTQPENIPGSQISDTISLLSFNDNQR